MYRRGLNVRFRRIHRLGRLSETFSKRWSASKSDHNPKSASSWSSKFFAGALGIGSFAGAMGSLAGMGGGFVMIPLMTSKSLLSLSQHQAHGTSLFAVSATGLSGALSYFDFVRWEQAAAIALTGIVTARFGARSASWLSGRSLNRALGGLMVLMAPMVHVKKYLMDEVMVQAKEESGKNTFLSNANVSKDILEHLGPAAAIGLGSGYLAGLFGVGGGVLVVPALVLFTSCDHYEALATSLAAMVLPAVAGTWTHYQAGNVAMRVAPGLAFGAILGAYAGGQLAQNYTNESTLRMGFSGLLLLLGVRTLMKAG